MSHPLRTTRLAAAALTSVLVTAVFLDLGHRIPASWVSVVTSLQFGPAFLLLLSSFGWSAVGLAFVVGLTMVFGRVYCSHLCPVGALQDVVVWARRRNYRHRRFSYAPPRYGWHYAITGLAILSAVGGSVLMLDLLEPFSNAGRFLVHLVRPAIVFANNAVAAVSRWAGGPSMMRLPWAWPGWGAIAGSLLFAALVGVLSYRSGRSFCNILCPVGGVLSVLSRRPAFAVTIREQECIDCGLCERVCRAQCLDSKRRVIDAAACVVCFDCIASCPTHGMEFSWRRGKASPGPSADRRRILTTLSAAVAGTITLKLPEGEREARWSAAKAKPVVPPGGKGRERFSGLCTACQLCVSACPTQVIQPSLTEYGWQGVFQARMEYSVNYCTFDCVACGSVCPTGALLPLTVEEKHTLQLGKAQFIKEDCIVEVNKKDCGACAEHCPTKAVRMVPYERSLTIPEVDNEYCVGCGACEHACPTTPRRAIYVDAHSVHQTAMKRKETRTAPMEAVPEEFPF